MICIDRFRRVFKGPGRAGSKAAPAVAWSSERYARLEDGDFPLKPVFRAGDVRAVGCSQHLAVMKRSSTTWWLLVPTSVPALKSIQLALNSARAACWSKPSSWGTNDPERRAASRGVKKHHLNIREGFRADAATRLLPGLAGGSDRFRSAAHRSACRQPAARPPSGINNPATSSSKVAMSPSVARRRFSQTAGWSVWWGNSA